MCIPESSRTELDNKQNPQKAQVSYWHNGAAECLPAVSQTEADWNLCGLLSDVTTDLKF